MRTSFNISVNTSIKQKYIGDFVFGIGFLSKFSRNVLFVRVEKKTTMNEISIRDPSTANCRIYVGNLKENTPKNDLQNIFSNYGNIRGIMVSRNFGFIQFDSEQSANNAIENENQKMYNGRKIAVSKVQNKGNQKRPDRQGSMGGFGAGGGGGGGGGGAGGGGDGAGGGGGQSEMPMAMPMPMQNAPNHPISNTSGPESNMNMSQSNTSSNINLNTNTNANNNNNMGGQQNPNMHQQRQNWMRNRNNNRNNNMNNNSGNNNEMNLNTDRERSPFGKYDGHFFWNFCAFLPFFRSITLYFILNFWVCFQDVIRNTIDGIKMVAIAVVVVEVVVAEVAAVATTRISIIFGITIETTTTT